jgi:hypothetical protein
MRRRPWAKRFEDRTKQSALLVLLFFASTSLSAAIVLAGGAIYVARWYDRQFDWRDDQYQVLEHLHAGFTRAKFVAALGTPVFDRRARGFREQTFRRREHWVQAVSDRSGVVVLYTVTACGSEFRPRFAIPGPNQVDGASVQLNGSTLDAVVHGHDEQLLRFDYFASGATANSRFQEIYAAGNPSNYKTFVWGLNDACGNWYDIYGSFFKSRLLPREALAGFKGALDDAPRWADRFRRRAMANTYGETAPDFELRSLHDAFQIGADRLLTRTTQGS